MKKFYTYIHTRADDGSVFYVGKGYSDRAWSKDNRNIYWRRTVAKHGYNVEIVARWVNEDDAFDHEKSLISCLKEFGCKLVNLTGGGEGSAGYKWTDEQKLKCDWSGEKNGMYGRKHSEETRKKIANKAIGRVTSELAKSKISKAMKERVFSSDHLERLRKAGIGNKNGLGSKANSKKCVISGIEYASTQDASKVLQLTANCIQQRCKNVKYTEFNYI